MAVELQGALVLHEIILSDIGVYCSTGGFIDSEFIVVQSNVGIAGRVSFCWGVYGMVYLYDGSPYNC